MIFIEILQLNCYAVPELPPSRNPLHNCTVVDLNSLINDNVWIYTKHVNEELGSRHNFELLECFCVVCCFIVKKYFK